MAKIMTGTYAEKFARFKRAAAKGHEESIWIVSVVKDVKMEASAVIEAFAKTEEPLGWLFAGVLSYRESREELELLDLLKNSAEAGCSWGQVWYGWFFNNDGDSVEQDEHVYVEWMEKSANQNNPMAMNYLGVWFRGDGDDDEEAAGYFRAAAELGWKRSMGWLSGMLYDGKGCERDLRKAAIWSAKKDSVVFWMLLADARRAFEEDTTEDLDCDFNQLCYALGWGLYWYLYDSEAWHQQDDEDQVFGNQCLDYYCSCVELQQKSIFTFLLCWNRTVGVKGPGQMIAQLVWEEREDNVVKRFEESDGEEPEMKRIKK
jgi:hypothetical protein